MSALKNICEYAVAECGLNFYDNGIYGLENIEDKYIAISGNMDNTINIADYNEAEMKLSNVAENMALNKAITELEKRTVKLKNVHSLVLVH